MILIYCYLVFKSFVYVLEKYDFIKKFKLFSAKKNSKLLYNLSECEFCINFWLAITPSILVHTLYTEINLIMLIKSFLMSFMISSLHIIIKPILIK